MFHGDRNEIEETTRLQKDVRGNVSTFFTDDLQS